MNEILRQLAEIPVEKSDKPLPERNGIVYLLANLKKLILPEYLYTLDMPFEDFFLAVKQQLKEEVSTVCDESDKCADIIMSKLPLIKHLILTDIQAIYDGDPAAKSKEEIVLAYPGFRAIFTYRIAHQLYLLNIPILPRIMTEYAHEKTGIDINPGAKIGEYFCIDHGTGVVIGETATLGDHVKLYQGVTIGAKSFRLDENGNPVKGGKRHPDIGNNVVIYANATILGGDTYIGDNSIIGGNSWIISSVDANSKVIHEE